VSGCEGNGQCQASECVCPFGTIDTTGCPFEEWYLGNLIASGTTTADTSVSVDILYNPSADYVYTFTLATAGLVTFSTCGSSFDTWIRILNEDMSSQIASNDDGCSSGYGSRLNTNLNAGTYTLLVEGYRSSEGSYTLEYDIIPQPSQPPLIPQPPLVPQPPQLIPQPPQLIPQPPQPVVVSLSGTGSIDGSTSQPSNFLGEDSNNQIYSFELTRTTTVTFSTCVASYDTFMWLYGSDIAATDASFIARDDDGCVNIGPNRRGSLFSTELEAGVYHLRVAGYGTASGEYTLQYSV